MEFYDRLVMANLKELGIEGFTRDKSEWVIASNVFKTNFRRYQNNLSSWNSYYFNGRKYLGVKDSIELYKWHAEKDLWEYPKCYYEEGYEKFEPMVMYY
jgi:hypothetical protein